MTMCVVEEMMGGDNILRKQIHDSYTAVMENQ
jgi:hypothetical protein